MLFFCTVGIATFLYLLYVFNYNEKLWYYYFPVSRRYQSEFWPDRDANMLPNASLNDHSALQHTPTIADSSDSKFVEKISVEIVKMENLQAMFGATFVLTFFFFLIVYYSILRWVIKVRINFGEQLLLLIPSFLSLILTSQWNQQIRNKYLFRLYLGKG